MSKFKIVFNACYGGYGLSTEAAKLLYSLLTPEEQAEISPDRNLAYTLQDAIHRHDSRLVHVIEQLGDKANGIFANLKIFETDSPMYFISEYDGYESVEVPESQEWITIPQ